MNKYIVFFFVLSLSLFSCADNTITSEEVFSCNDGVKNGDEEFVDCGGSCSEICPPTNAIGGEVKDRLVLRRNKEYILFDPLIIRQGASLEIEAGAVIKAAKDRNVYLAVAQGGRFYAWGDKENPIVFTSENENPSAGDWGGIVLCGFAPTNNGINSRSEVVDYFYGGNTLDDSSGFINYLRIEYAGMPFNEHKNFNGLSLYGVGNITKLRNIQVYNSAGNGIEIIGGSVNVSNFVAMNCENSLKVNEGWSGNLDFLYSKDAINSHIYLSNNTTNFNTTPITDVAITNTTLVNSTSRGAVSFLNGGAKLNLSSMYTSALNLGFYIEDSSAKQFIDDGFVTINAIEFDNTNSTFEKSNYSSLENYIKETQNSGAGNKNQKPIWAEGWTRGF